MKFNDFYEAYQWLYNHPVFQYQCTFEELSEPQLESFFDYAVDVEVVKVNPENNTIEDDPKLNIKTRVWFEISEDYDEKYHTTSTHIWYLDTGGNTYEEAMISLANLVYKFYKDGDELLLDPYEVDEG